MHDIRPSQHPHIAIGFHIICANAAKYDNLQPLGAMGSQRNGNVLLHSDVHLTLTGKCGPPGRKVQQLLKHGRSGKAGVSQ